MTRVDFYVLNQASREGRELLACRLAEKAYRLGHQVYIHAADRSKVEQMDRMLWTFKQNSFVPHAIEGESPDPGVPVTLGCGEMPAAGQRDVLINLDAGVPLFFSSFERVAEVISPDPADKASGRERYRFYRDRGYPMDTHQL